MNKIIKSCDVCIDGNVISQELLLATFSDFILSTIEKEKHNVSIVLHTGSVCFDAIILACAAVSNLLYNQTNANDIISQLIPGDVVLYYNSNKSNSKAQRYTFKGFVDSPDEPPRNETGTYVWLTQGNSGRLLLPSACWNRIVPYWGNASSMDGRGLRRDSGNRYRFLKSVLGLGEEEIIRISDTSTVVIMARDTANSLVNGLSFRFGNEEVRLTELVPVSYFTENEEYPYGGNPAKSEPVLKITGKVSKARELLLKRGGNKNVGLIVSGDSIIRLGNSEIPELVERQSIQYVYLCMHINSDFSEKLVSSYENASLFACTKDFLLSNSLDVKVKNDYTNQLSAQVNAIIDHEVITKELPSYLSWEEYRKFKRAMFFIKESDYESDSKDSFVMQAFSLMNLFKTALFSMKTLESFIDSREIDTVEKPEARLAKIEDCANSFPEYLHEAAMTVIETLETAYLLLVDHSAKEDTMREIISQNFGKSIAIVLPKAYYATVVKSSMDDIARENSCDITLVTANRFNGDSLYDIIIVSGNVTGARFDALRCQSAQCVFALLYDFEKYQFKSRIRKAVQTEHLFNRRSTIYIEDEYEEQLLDPEESEVDEVEAIDADLTNYIGATYLNTVHNNSYSPGAHKSVADIVAVAKFDTDEVAFFTKNYKAYVLDDAERSVKEVDVTNLSDGDIIVFTRSNSTTRDIVENLLSDMMKNKLVSAEVEDAYYKAGWWKSVLTKYLKHAGCSAKTLADTMIENGVSVQEATIRTWLDDDAHTVRPRKLDSIQQIALIAGDEDLFDNAESCYAAGGVIYKVRRKILKAIGQAILGEITGENDNSDPIMRAVSERVGNAAVVLQIETITFVNDTVPLNTINRPISVD